MAPLLVLQRWMSTRRSFVLMAGRYQRRVLSLGRWRWPVFGMLLLTVALMSLLPLLLQLAAHQTAVTLRTGSGRCIIPAG